MHFFAVINQKHKRKGRISAHRTTHSPPTNCTIQNRKIRRNCSLQLMTIGNDLEFPCICMRMRIKQTMTSFAISHTSTSNAHTSKHRSLAIYSALANTSNEIIARNAVSTARRPWLWIMSGCILFCVLRIRQCCHNDLRPGAHAGRDALFVRHFFPFSVSAIRRIVYVLMADADFFRRCISEDEGCSPCMISLQDMVVLFFSGSCRFRLVVSFWMLRFYCLVLLCVYRFDIIRVNDVIYVGRILIFMNDKWNSHRCTVYAHRSVKNLSSLIYWKYRN